MASNFAKSPKKTIEMNTYDFRIQEATGTKTSTEVRRADDNR